MTDATSLYRHFGADGSLLYVGISLSWPARTKAHVRQSRWFEEVARVEIERFPSRDEALRAEREAIKSEGPRFNVVHNTPSRAKVTVRGERRKFRPSGCGDPVLELIKGPDAIVGPALVYREDVISVMVAHGETGSAGELTELVLGNHFHLPSWTSLCDTILTIRRPDDLTIGEARELRCEIVKKLKKHLRSVQVFDADLAFAVAYASQFPSDKSRRILDEIAVERGAAA